MQLTNDEKLTLIKVCFETVLDSDFDDLPVGFTARLVHLARSVARKGEGHLFKCLREREEDKVSDDGMAIEIHRQAPHTILRDNWLSVRTKE